MGWRIFERLLDETNLFLLGALLFGIMCVVAATARLLHRRRNAARGEEAHEREGQEGYIVSAVLGLLALLLGFTFSLSVERFETRRNLVLQEANAIGTAYLRSQLLPQPHRARMTGLLARYADNRIALARAGPNSLEQRRLLQINDSLITDIWAGTSASFDSIKRLAFANAYLEAVNAVIDLDESRKTARMARVPPEVFAILFVYLVTTAGVLGYVLWSPRGRAAGGFLLALLTLSLMLIVDINRPTQGAITESQQPMEDLQRSLASQSPTVFDKWRAAAPP